MGLDAVPGLFGNAGDGFGHRAVIEIGYPAALPANETILMAVIALRIVRCDDVVLAAVEQMQARQHAEVLQQFEGAKDGCPA